MGEVANIRENQSVVSEKVGVDQSEMTGNLAFD